ncbi:tRNA uridine-5-carboxymethylaminomethyl(34) synthesis GTPase MnmE [Anaerostipes sp.]|uniref:tRNA uridine-5-carboxymethylaminomethyl(34) synthesis GTPase MnmE n=1 Tax=Anaerostipes sp. TaxID=1872530 RepID=UPI0025BB89C9|nr:tRNA uridine-5-carboxymethylaminomethyl(34) synthesis GTPase MnmE [Anaerostipes sp.]MBS7009050.1 tRNA uridine-5-carboxymethylaminomethyl(34) synthesis GTPase MnmE [Anaerostipes sp.]
MGTDTIAAIATPLTNSGIGIIRISGPEAIDIVSKVFRPKRKKDIKKAATYTAHYGHAVKDGKDIDECILLIMKGPHSYTAEDVAEINCHGGVIVMKKILSCVIEAGARPAEPGEFTKRAFLNGRIDLSKAEAVMDLIHSKNEFAMETSLKQLKGALSEKIKLLRKEILHSVAFIESALDDPEHYSVEGFSEKLRVQVEHARDDVQKYIDSSDNGRILKEGIHTAIVGKPNAGKSSILNVLLGEERAIVTDIAGTTRDTLEESIQINGIPLNVIDTAGIRDTEDIVEKIGVDKARDSVIKSDLVLYVVDTSVPLTKEDEDIMDLLKDKQVIVLLNKSDLDTEVSETEFRERGFNNITAVSAKNLSGLEELYEKINELFFHGRVSFNDEVYITNMRHKKALSNAKESLELVLTSIDNEMPEDFFSIDLMNAYEELGYIIGESVGEDLVNEIFAEFCMGK